MAFEAQLKVRASHYSVVKMEVEDEVYLVFKGDACGRGVRYHDAEPVSVMNRRLTRHALTSYNLQGIAPTPDTAAEPHCLTILIRCCWSHIIAEFKRNKHE